MADCDSKACLSFSLIPSLTFGVSDGINPCGVTTSLIFFIFLVRVAHTRRQILLLGFVYIIAAGVANYFLLMGAGDIILQGAFIQKMIRILYLVFACVFVLTGVWHFVDWWRYKCANDVKCFRIKLPGFFGQQPCLKTSSKVAAIFRKGLIALVGIILAFLTAIMANIYPQSEYIFILHSFMMSGGDLVFVWWSFVLYSLAFILPVIITWVFIIWMSERSLVTGKFVSYFKGVLAAVLIATGIGLGYVFLKVII